MHLKKFLKRTSLSVDSFATKFGINAPAAYSWLSDRAVPKYETMRELLLNGCRLDELFDEEVLAAVMNTHAVDRVGMSLDPDTCVQIVKNGLAMMEAMGQPASIHTK